MARKKPSNIKASGVPEYIAHTDARGRQTQLETRLGRLVLKLTKQPVDAGLCLIYSPFRAQWTPAIDANRFGWFDNPIDALLAAGIRDD